MHPYLKTLMHKFLKNKKTNSFIQFLNLHQTCLGAQKTVLGYENYLRNYQILKSGKHQYEVFA